MINFWKTEGGRLVAAEAHGDASWIDVREATSAELLWLERDIGILPELLSDILDLDEQPRIEKEEGYTMIIVRVPVIDPSLELEYVPVPLGIVLFPDKVLTICMKDNETLRALSGGRVRELAVQNKSAFVLKVLGRAAFHYLRFLKDINKKTAVIERELQRSIKNHELTRLLSMEKSLVYFTTSLKSNELLLDKLQKSSLMRFKEDEYELLEDVVTDCKQAIEMSNIYSSILSGMMDAYASVISNNINIVMRRLTIVSIVLMVPTLVASFYGMNVGLPLQGSEWAFPIILAISAGTSLISALLLKDRGSGKPRRVPRAPGS